MGDSPYVIYEVSCIEGVCRWEQRTGLRKDTFLTAARLGWEHREKTGHKVVAVLQGDQFDRVPDSAGLPMTTIEGMRL